MFGRKALLSVMGITAILGLVGSGTFALFTGNAANTGNTFSTGDVDISVSPSTSAIHFNNMAPGDVFTGPIAVHNSGTLDLRYAVSDVATNTDNKGLAGQLTLTIKIASSAAACTTAGFASLPDAIYSGTLGTTDGSSQNIIGNPDVQPNGGRTIAAGAADDVLCLQAQLPIGTGNGFQNATTSAVFTFDAEQVLNNP